MFRISIYPLGFFFRQVGAGRRRERGQKESHLHSIWLDAAGLPSVAIADFLLQILTNYVIRSEAGRLGQIRRRTLFQFD